ncbi:MAG: DUF58 domain-containing protein [Polyangiaceae bacterium]|nr:DUF58 domain-containing protein [Polyangiaceae bacterium]
MAAPREGRALRQVWQHWRASRRFERLNHILIPQKKADRDRLRNGRLAWLLRPLSGSIQAYSRQGRALLLITMLVGCSALDVRMTQTHQLFAMLVALLLVSFLARPLFRTPGLRVMVTGPDRVTAGAPARFDLRFANDGPSTHLNLSVEPPFLPWDGRWLRSAAGVAELRRGQHVTVTTTATFLARGEHHLDGFEIGALVPLGLALGRRTHAEVPRFLVVPKLANVVALRMAHRLPERRGAALATLRAGESDIAGVRPYRAGDPLKHLHARTWARTGVPHVRTYVDERHDRVALVVVVDGSEASERTKEATLSLAAGIAARLALHDAGIDELLIDEAVFGVEPRAGKRALDRVLDRLAVHELTGQRCATADALTTRLSRFSALVLVSAGAAARHRSIVELARRRNVPIRWAAVADPAFSPSDTANATVVDVDTIEEGRVIPL